MKISLSFIFDTAFYFVAGFFLFFIPVNFIVTRPASFVISVTLAVIFTLFIVKLSQSKKNKKFISVENEKKYKEFISSLNLTDEKEQTEIFATALRKDGYIAEKRNGGIFIAEKKTTVFIKFGFDGVTKTDIVKCFNKIPKTQKAEIYSESFSEEISEFARRFGGKIILSDGKKAFGLLERNDLLPKQNPYIDNSDKKPTLDFHRLLDKKRAKNYLAFGLLFMFLSYIAPIKGYYIVFGALFLIFALVLKLFGKTSV